MAAYSGVNPGTANIEDTRRLLERIAELERHLEYAKTHYNALQGIVAELERELDKQVRRKLQCYQELENVRAGERERCLSQRPQLDYSREHDPEYCKGWADAGDAFVDKIRALGNE